MSDFGAVYDYALALEASIPAAEMAKFEAMRPAVLGMTARQKEEAARAQQPAPQPPHAAAEAAKPAPPPHAAADDKRK